ncbi:hypothetical protein R1flu_014219 [Riccia fluitans]|uniref:Uncharacterized protein n=1 Tax=Riccia fluitans TaxID=41844 RepID=A0ABD1YFQ2_9MARC
MSRSGLCNGKVPSYDCRIGFDDAQCPRAVRVALWQGYSSGIHRDVGGYYEVSRPDRKSPGPSGRQGFGTKGFIADQMVCRASEQNKHTQGYSDSTGHLSVKIQLVGTPTLLKWKL